MNSFMNALWNAENAQVSGFKNEVGFLAKIINVRVKFGGELQARLQDVDTGETFLVDGNTLFNGEGGVFRNLHVFF